MVRLPAQHRTGRRIPGRARRGLSPIRTCVGPTCARTTSGSSTFRRPVCPSSSSRVDGWTRGQARPTPVGAVVAYGRRFVGRGAHTVNVVPPRRGGAHPGRRGLLGSDAGRRAVWSTPGCSPTRLVLRARGLRLLLPGPEGRLRRPGRRRGRPAVADQQTSAGRESAIRVERPTMHAEAWRAYYHARNSVRAGPSSRTPAWYVWHLAYSARHLQLARSSRGAVRHRPRPVGRGPGPPGREPALRREVGSSTRSRRDPDGQIGEVRPQGQVDSRQRPATAATSASYRPDQARSHDVGIQLRRPRPEARRPGGRRRTGRCDRAASPRKRKFGAARRPGRGRSARTGGRAPGRGSKCSSQSRGRPW